MGRIIGIDLGTTNSLVTVWDNGECKLIPNSFGDYLTPSIVSVDPDGTVYVGKTAKERQIFEPDKTTGMFKRYMGTTKKYQLGKRRFLPEELSAMVLRKLKEDAERYLKEEVEEAIISVPAYFNDVRRKAVKKAGKLAGLLVERIINEPSAAALAHRKEDMQEDSLMMVFDFGGGTLDVSLVECFDNIIEIIAVSGDNSIGGKNFDEVLAIHFIKKCGLQDRKLSDATKEIIKAAAEKCKKDLTISESAMMKVSCDELLQRLEITRKDLMDISQEIFKRIIIPIKNVLLDGNVEANKINKIIMVGGSSKMPVIKQYLRQELGRDDIEAVNPDYLIALGVGTYAGIKERNKEIRDLVLTDICPFSLGISVRNDKDPKKSLMGFIIQRNSALPVSIEKEFYQIYNKKKKSSIKIYQGESMYTKDNMLLGVLAMEPLVQPKEMVSVNIRFTYDINGVLEVNAFIPLTGENKHIIIANKELDLSEEDVKQKLEELEKLKLYPADDEENQYVLFWGKRLFTVCSGGLRQEIFSRVQYFETVLRQKDIYQIKKKRRDMMVFLDYVEKLIEKSLEFNEEEFLKMDWLNEIDNNGGIE